MSLLLKAASHVAMTYLVSPAMKLRHMYMWKQYLTRLLRSGTQKMLTDKDYDMAYAVVAAHEGWKITRDPIITKGGVTQEFLDSHNINQDVTTMTPEQRKEIFYDYIWQPCKYGYLSDLRVATKAFDMNVNMGQHQSTLLFQRCINEVSNAEVIVDGFIGMKTIEAANKCNPDNLLAALRQSCVDFYETLVKKDPKKNKKYEDGWINRAWS